MVDGEEGGRMPDDVQKASMAIMQKKSAEPNLPPRPEERPLGSDRGAVEERVAKSERAPGAASEVAESSDEPDDVEGEDQGDGSEEEQDPNEISPDDLTEEEDAENPDGQSEDDDPEHEITVDGEKIKVKLSELKNNYSGEKAIEKRLQQATELRNGYYQYGTALYQGLSMQSEKLKQLDSVLQQMADPQINWAELQVKDPNRYLMEREKQRDAKDKRAAIEQEQKNITAQQQALVKKEREVKADDEARILMQKVPELRDPQKGRAMMEGMIKGGVDHYGFQPQEIADVIDHRMLMVLNDAVKYRNLVARKNAKMTGQQRGNQKQVQPQGAVKTLLRPGANAGFSRKMAVAKQEKANVEKARSTGQPEDVAKLLITKPMKRTGR